MTLKSVKKSAPLYGEGIRTCKRAPQGRAFRAVLTPDLKKAARQQQAAELP